MLSGITHTDIAPQVTAPSINPPNTTNTTTTSTPPFKPARPAVMDIKKKKKKKKKGGPRWPGTTTKTTLQEEIHIK